MESTYVLHIQSAEFFTKWTYGKVEAEMFSPPWRSEHVQRNLTGKYWFSWKYFGCIVHQSLNCYSDVLPLTVQQTNEGWAIQPKHFRKILGHIMWKSFTIYNWSNTSSLKMWKSFRISPRCFFLLTQTPSKRFTQVLIILWKLIYSNFWKIVPFLIFKEQITTTNITLTPAN